MMMQCNPRRQSGALMIEVLIAIAIIVFGVMAVMRVQARLQLSEAEVYQRTQALILLNDMVNRIETNRNNAADYVTEDVSGDLSPLGSGMTCALPAIVSPATANTLQEFDSLQWCNALQGAAETQGGNQVGAILGGRGCVEEIVGPGVREYMVTVVWQGMTPISAPPDSISCGANAFDQAGTVCVNDLCRRYVSTIVRQADL